MRVHPPAEGPSEEDSFSRRIWSYDDTPETIAAIPPRRRYPALPHDSPNHSVYGRESDEDFFAERPDAEFRVLTASPADLAAFGLSEPAPGMQPVRLSRVLPGSCFVTTMLFLASETGCAWLNRANLEALRDLWCRLSPRQRKTTGTAIVPGRPVS